MNLLYSIFACSVILGAIITVISIIRSGYTDTSGISSFLYTPEEHL